MPKHSPAPWFWLADDGGPVLTDAQGNAVSFQVEENRTVIAGAPRMLQLLRRIAYVEGDDAAIEADMEALLTEMKDV